MGKMLGQAALGIGGSIAEGVGNVIFGEFNQRQQLRGQKKALEQQNAAQLDLWNKTNYGAQMKHLKEAGLNPALIYGQSGGGATTAGSGSANVAGGQAGMSVRSAMDLAMAKAQIENINADTKNKLVTAEKTAGVDTDKVRADIGATMESINLIRSQVKNEDSKTALNKISYELNKLEFDYNERTLDSRIDATFKSTDTIVKQLELLSIQKDINEATKGTMIKQASANLAQSYVDIAYKKQGIDESKQNVEESKARMLKMVRDVFLLGVQVNTQAEAQKTNQLRLELDQMVHDLPDSEKVMFMSILQMDPIERIFKGHEDKMPKGKTSPAPKGKIKVNKRSGNGPSGYNR